MTAYAVRASTIDDPVAMRRATSEVLSLALIDARNRLLQSLAVFDQHGSLAAGATTSPLWLAGNSLIFL